VILCLENLSESWSDFLPLFVEIDTFGMTLDIGHGELLSKENRSYGFITNCFDYIKHIHIHDNLGGDSPEDDLHLPLGEGKIDFPSILLDLRGKGYDNNITLEVNTNHLVNGKKIIEETLLRESDEK
jgi:sugar phosphate isomerase/epimerase